MDYCTRKLLGLTDKNLFFGEDWLFTEKRKDVEAFIVSGELTYRPKCCEKCGEINEGQIVKNGTKTTETQLPPFNQRLTFLQLKRSRFLCRSCQSTFVAHTPIVKANCQLSRALTYQIALELSYPLSRKDIAKKFFVSDHTVLRIQKELVKTYKVKYSYLPRVLCLDEFKSMASCKGAMSFVCVDGEQNELFEILEDRRLSQLIKHFMRFSRKARKKVKYLVMDMNASYAQLIKTVFPCAVIVTDRFHIVQHITRSFNQLRVKIMNQFRTNDSEEQKKYRRLKRYWKLLLKDSDTIRSDHSHYHRLFKREMYPQDIIDELLSYDIRLKIAYDAVQYLHYYRKKKDVKSFFQQISDLDKRLPLWFRKKFYSLRKHRQGIGKAFHLPYSNGVTEGINNKIKLIKRVSYGYRNFYNLRDRIYIAKGLIFQQT